MSFECLAARSVAGMKSAKFLKSLIFAAIFLGAPMFQSFSNPQCAYAQGHGKGTIGLGAKDAPNGAEVGVLTPGGPAERAGVRIGDVITAVNGYPVQNATAMTDAVHNLAPGQTARLSILRGGQRMTISVIIGGAGGNAAPASAPTAAAAPSGPAKPISVAGYTTFTDPLENAFTMQAPSGWHTVGGMARRAALQINAFLRSVSPDKMTYLIVGEPTLIGYVPPAPWRTASGYPEGKLFDSGLGGLSMVLRYKNGSEYARLYGQTTLQGLCSNLRYTGGGERSDMAASADKLVPSAFPAVSSGGEARFTCTHGGQEMEARMQVVTRIARDNAMWNVIFLKGFVAPKSQADKAQEILDRVGGSFRYNAAWSQKQSALDQAAANQINRNMKHYFQQEQPIIRSMNQTDESFSSMDDIVSGYSTYHDAATGNDYKLSNTNPYKWQDPSTGRIVSTPENIPPTWGNYQPMPRVG
jgi:hypothetical protein